ncbi:probable RNA-binding protein 18 [Cimex lectularius]|uniref:Probable RNA-binding protein 18 n=1 Tax=Cimex lectularius TaxID=79782 RepID=A0A8I6TGQ2_CIMLE|nr:probable RNA-binding protein 18 [Cimex lectularius]
MPLTSPLPLPEKDVNEDIERRLWIGNLDPRITEFQLVKILQKYGQIDKFDLLYHKTGPQAGQPRGYAFVTFVDSMSAKHMMADLDRKIVGNKMLSIKWAHNMGNNDFTKQKNDISIPALGVRDEKKINRRSQILAIESKLRMMKELPAEEFQVSNLPSSSRPSMFNMNSVKNNGTKNLKLRSQKEYTAKRSKPYRKL